MPIDRSQLLSDVLLWLPEDNILTDQQILLIIEKVISELPADDDEYYAEALCKSLEACAKANKALTSTSSNNIKREKSYQREVEYYDSSNSSTWDDYLDSLPDLCETFGYCGLRSRAAACIKVNVPDPIRVPCGSVSYGRTGFDGCNDGNC